MIRRSGRVWWWRWRSLALDASSLLSVLVQERPQKLVQSFLELPGLTNEMSEHCDHGETSQRSSSSWTPSRHPRRASAETRYLIPRVHWRPELQVARCVGVSLQAPIWQRWRQSARSVQRIDSGGEARLWGCISLALFPLFHLPTKPDQRSSPADRSGNAAITSTRVLQ